MCGRLGPVKTTTYVLALALLLPASVQAQDGAAMRGVIHQDFIMLLNPMGMQHTLSTGFRGELGDQDDILFTGAHAETGLVSYVAPVFAINGAYAEISPLSFLVLRAELTQNVVWPIGMEGAGYFGLDSETEDVQVLAAERAESAVGWSARLGATLQGAIPLGPVRLLIADQLTAQYAEIGAAPFYYDMRWDLVMAREDWVLINNAVVLVDIPLDATLKLRAGAYDDLRYVPRSGYIGHQVGPIVALTIEHPAPEVPEVTPYIRAGYYTDHVVRAEEFTILAGVSVTYDLGAVQ
jgi:hypothetical protein